MANFSIFGTLKDAIQTLKLETLPDIAEFVRSRIQAQARSGKTMASGASGPIPALTSAEYIAYRQRLAAGVRASKKSGKTPPQVGEFFSPKRSNLTLTGQYLDSISTTKIDLSECSFTIAPTGQRADGKLTNDKLGEYLDDQGRSVWGIDTTTKNRIIAMVKADIRNQILKNLSKK